MIYYPEPESHIRDKFKVVLGLSKYTTKKELEHATGVDTSGFVAKKDFVAMKVEVDKLDINNLVNVPTNLNSLKIRWFRCWWIKNCSYRLKKIKWCSRQKSLKKTKFNMLRTKVNKIGKKISEATTLIQINQYNTHK